MLVALEVSVVVGLVVKLDVIDVLVVSDEVGEVLVVGVLVGVETTHLFPMPRLRVMSTVEFPIQGW